MDLPDDGPGEDQAVQEENDPVASFFVELAGK